MKTFKTIIAVLFLVSMVTPSSYAVDRKSDENSPSQASLSDNISINDNQTIDKESEPVNLFKISGIKSDRSFMIDGEEEGSKLFESGSDVILRSFITIKDIPQSIVMILQ